MLSLHVIKDVKIGGVEVNTYAILRNKVYPVLEASLFLAHIAQKSPSIETVRAFGNDLLMFFRELSEVNDENGILGRDFRDITDNEMNAYLNAYLRKKHGLKLNSINRHISTLRSFYNYAYLHGWMNEKRKFSFLLRHDNVKTSELEGIKKKLTLEYMSKKDLKTLLENIPDRNFFNCKRDQLVLMLGYYANFRTRELINPNNLRVSDLEELITLDENGIPFIKKPMKVYGKGNKIRNVRVWPELVQPLYDFLKMAKSAGAKNLICKQNGTPLINKAHGTKTFRMAVINLKLRGDISEDEAELWRLRYYHCLRRCYATNAVTYCYKEGYDSEFFVRDWMGHANYETTKVYIFFEAILNKRTLNNNELNMKYVLRKYEPKEFSE